MEINRFVSAELVPARWGRQFPDLSLAEFVVIKNNRVCKLWEKVSRQHDLLLSASCCDQGVICLSFLHSSGSSAAATGAQGRREGRRGQNHLVRSAGWTQAMRGTSVRGSSEQVWSQVWMVMNIIPTPLSR